MAAIESLHDALGVLRVGPWLFLPGGVAALVSTLNTAADSGVLALVDLLVGAWVAAGIIGVAFVELYADRLSHSFIDTANSYALRLVGARILAGIIALLVLGLPAIIAWTVLKPELVTLLQGASPAFGVYDALVTLLVLVA